MSEHLGGILSKGLPALLEAPRIPDLSLLYSLFSRVKNGLTELCAHFNTYIKVSFIHLFQNMSNDAFYAYYCYDIGVLINHMF